MQKVLFVELIMFTKLLFVLFSAAGREESTPTTQTAHSVAAKSFKALFIPMNEEGFPFVNW